MMYRTSRSGSLSNRSTRNRSSLHLAQRSLAGLVCLSTLALNACSYSTSLVEDSYSRQIEDVYGGYPLPSGSYYEAANSRPAGATGDNVDLSSFAPDNRLPQDRIPKIVKRGRVIVGVDQSLNLLSYRDSTSGELAGFEIELAQEIARDIFGNPHAVEFRYVSSQERIERLQKGDVDLVLRTMTVNPDRQKKADFSVPYLTAHAGILVSSDNAQTDFSDLRHKRICVSKGATTEETVRRQAPDSTLLLVGNWSDCLVALQNGQAEVVVADDTILAGINDQDPATAIVRRGLNEESYAAGIRKGDIELTRQVNATLERIRRDGTWQRLYDNWFGPFLPGGEQPVPEYKTEQPKSETESEKPTDTESAPETPRDDTQ